MNDVYSRTLLRPAALPIALAAALSPTWAFAQSAQDQEEKPTNELDRITVIGSRVPRAVETESAAPVLTLDRTAIEQTGLTSVGDVLFNITASDGGALRNVTTSTNGSDGTQNVSLRGLGAGRTLILVNGRRWVAQNGIVDLNTIPIAMVERIEVLKDGASAIYGSDAIAGVINVITRKNFDGAEANVYLGGYSKGDGFQQSYDFTVGADSERWNAVIGISYQDQEPVFAGDREISSVPVFGAGDVESGGFAGSATTPRGSFVRCAGAFTPTSAGFRTCTPVSNGPGTGPGTGIFANNVTLRPGEDGRQASDFSPFVSYTLNGSGTSDRYNFSPVNYLLQPIERFNLYTQASLRLTDRVNASMQAVYTNRGSVQQLGEVPLTMNVSGVNGPQWAFAPTADNVFNPFGQNLSSASFRAASVGPRNNSFEHDTLAVTLALDGTFQLFGRNMYWDAGYSYLSWRRSQTGENYINLFNLRNAVGRSRRNPTTGALECLDSAGGVIAGCVPFNVFGGPDLGLANGVITREERDAMLRYVSYSLNDNIDNVTNDYFANLSGELFELPAGPVGFAMGVEHRRETLAQSQDALVAGGGSSTNFAEPTSGEVSVDEFYAELNVPVLSEIPGFKMLELNMAARRSDYDSSGSFGGRSVEPDIGGSTSKKIGLKWQVFDDLLLRGTYSESFLAPSVFLLYGGGTESFPPATDPCNRANIGASVTNRARCQADGVPNIGVVQLNGQIRSLNGGNPGLKPEFGETTSLGLVYSPSWAEGLNFSLDWYRIKLTDALTGRGAQGVLNGCYQNIGSTPTAPVDAAQQAQFCSLIQRDAAGNILELRTSTFNLTDGDVEGYDFQVSYALPETAWGRFGFQWDSTYTTENNLAGGTARGITIGTYNGAPNWRLRSNLNTTWQKGDWDASWAMRYYSKLVENCPYGPNYFEYGITPSEICNHTRTITDANGNPLLLNQNKIASRLYHDVQVGWKTPWNGRFVLGARNVFGKDPPRVLGSFAHSFDGAYDLPGGGFFYMQYNQKF
jgi:iron complex outermembrane recepter protein